MQRGSIPHHPATATPDVSSLTETAGKKSIYKTFKTGEGLPPHQAQVDVVVLVLKGQLDITLGEETSRFQAGDYVYFPARQIHSLTCVEEANVVIYK